MSRENRDMKVGILQVGCCRPIEGTDALKNTSLSQHLEWELVKGPVQNVQVQDLSQPTAFLGYNEIGFVKT